MQLRRYTLPLHDPSPHANVTMRVIGDTSLDLPAVNDLFRGKPHRYVYGIGNYRPNDWWNTIVKVDTVTGKTRTWLQPNHWPSEPVFVPRPGGAAEDDGCVLSIVLNGDTRKSYLLVLNATDWTELAEAHAPIRLPFTSHGFFNAGPCLNP